MGNSLVHLGAVLHHLAIHPHPHPQEGLAGKLPSGTQPEGGGVRSLEG